MSATKIVRAVPVRDFSDAGTERRFTSGQAVDLTEGEFENFRIAGLVTAEAPAPDAGDAAPAKRTR
jgi:hypothetical protein